MTSGHGNLDFSTLVSFSLVFNKRILNRRAAEAPLILCFPVEVLNDDLSYYPGCYGTVTRHDTE